MSRQTGEAKLTKQILEFLDEAQKRGLPVFFEHRSGSGGFNYKKGIPDLYVVVDGVHIELELKTTEGKRSAMQDKFKYRCEQIWHIPYCCPHSFEEFIEFIDPYIKKMSLTGEP